MQEMIEMPQQAIGLREAFFFLLPMLGSLGATALGALGTGATAAGLGGLGSALSSAGAGLGSLGSSIGAAMGFGDAAGGAGGAAAPGSWAAGTSISKAGDIFSTGLDGNINGLTPEGKQSLGALGQFLKTMNKMQQQGGGGVQAPQAGMPSLQGPQIDVSSIAKTVERRRNGLGL